MPAKILLVDDEPELLELLSVSLEQQGFTVVTAQTAGNALTAVRSHRPDLIILDVMLPDVSGTNLANQLKNNPETARIPILMLTAKDTETDVVVGLAMGADDYVTKPFRTPVLVARIEALLRRFAAGSTSTNTLAVGPVKLIPANHEVFVKDKPIELTLAEFKILEALMTAGGAVLSREQLLEQFGSDSSVTPRTIDVHIGTIRKKLGAARDLLKTIHRLGYRFSL